VILRHNLRVPCTALGLNGDDFSWHEWTIPLFPKFCQLCFRGEDTLDHVIALNEEHLRRILRDYVNYHHEDRLHDSLQKDTPNRRAVEQRPAMNSAVISMPRLGGLHHRYTWREAA
jgi:hypothetical protein